MGDATLFTRSDEVEAAWEFVAPVIEGCSRDAADNVLQYAAGTWGPKEADALIEGDGKKWHLRCL
jgi:glucose-6-phosphate 1-dehydrogenase